MLDAMLAHRPPSPTVALVLAGGAALGAYEAGVYAALHDAPNLAPTWLAASSIGSVNAAIIAGNRPDQRVEKLRQFWAAAATDPLPITSFWLGRPTSGAWRSAYNQAGVLEAVLFGRPTIFRPRIALGPRTGVSDVSALYDLDPLRRHFDDFIDFDILNSGALRLSIATTDVETGERITFDSSRQQIGPEHVVASCALMPVFAPVQVEGRLLGDGGLSANTPIDLVLDSAGPGELLCFAVELFAREGSRPHTLGASLNRAVDVAFANQTRQILEGRQREHRLRQMIGRLGDFLPPELRADPDVAGILSAGRPEKIRLSLISYRAALDEAGPGKLFDYSRATLDDRWRDGAAAMREALVTLDEPDGWSDGFATHEIAHAPDGADA